jgi:hypothetical protein
MSQRNSITMTQPAHQAVAESYGGARNYDAELTVPGSDGDLTIQLVDRAAIRFEIDGKATSIDRDGVHKLRKALDAGWAIIG